MGYSHPGGTDHRSGVPEHRFPHGALPALGTVERSHFDTVTFLGDSITEGMECYATGYQNAHVRAYRGAGPESVVYNTTVKDHIRNVQEPAFDAVVRPSPMRCISCSAPTPWSTAARTPPPSSSPIMKKMIDMFHESLPNVPIYVQSIPGVQEWVKDSKPGLQNDRIKLVNNLLANMALRGLLLCQYCRSPESARWRPD